MRGGYRVNSGRKRGYSAIEAEKAREFIVGRVNASLEPIISALINRAKQGDNKAIQILFDRAYGKPLTPIEADVVDTMKYVIRIDE